MNRLQASAYISTPKILPKKVRIRHFNLVQQEQFFYYYFFFLFLFLSRNRQTDNNIFNLRKSVMQPILKADEQQPTSTQTNGYVKQVNGTPKSKPNQEKIVLPVEMASMISLKSLIGKLVHKSYADLLTLTDTYGKKK